MPDREDMKSILEACRRTGPMDESLVRGTVESSSSNICSSFKIFKKITRYRHFHFHHKKTADN